MKKTLIIEDGGKMIRFKNRKVRTPVTLEVSDAELKQLKVQMKLSDIQCWKVIDKSEIKDSTIEYDYKDLEDVVIEKLDDDSDSILGRFMKHGEDE